MCIRDREATNCASSTHTHTPASIGAANAKHNHSTLDIAVSYTHLEIAVEKAKAELERLKDQKTLRVYMEGEGFVWRTDESAIRDAQEALRCV